MKKEKGGRPHGQNTSDDKDSTIGVQKTEPQHHVLNVPVRIGRRKLVCHCGAKLFVKKTGFTDFTIECYNCRERKKVSILATPSAGVRYG